MAVGGTVWSSHYTWSGIVYVGRGEFQPCLETSVKFWEKGGMGSCLIVTTWGVP